MQTQHAKPLGDAERLDWLRLIRSENVGPIVFKQLLQRFRTPAAALEALPSLAGRGGAKRRIRVCTKEVAESELAASRKAGVQLLALPEPGYPPLLRDLEDAPPLLAVLGDPTALTLPSVGIVGARNASANGRRFAEGLAREISEAGFVVASGMARGIDTAAHRGCLPRPSIAVLAGGVDIVYPPENKELHKNLQQAGAVISEIPLGITPQARHFPRRNRLISGLCLGVVIVEAARRSGSLITARFAAEQGRDVFAVPGSPLDPRASGCNHLIREGATLVESASQVLEDLGRFRRQQLATPEPTLDDAPAPAQPGSEREHHNLEDLLSAEPLMVDELVRRSGLPIAAVHNALLDLELAGRIERHPGNRVARLYKAPADPL
ncbi:DNA-protecting protein DprA [Pelagibius litoralis]|uniref:DNA-protecting protein DprA n=1 Tax=Pelagibius litoralis TaxID=374515 RepID=A0A967EZE5_9PROT|nr:DNA-processing protein DprA [Pelagibius litoralis]NIA70256.1 DNA-protecting protein DprA [Pelagibius litoralis]